MPTKLSDSGYIPAGEICPFKDKCDLAKDNLCRHKGEDHEVDFSCGIATAFEISLMEFDDGVH